MRTLQKRQYDTLVRVRDFGAAHQHLFPESSLAPQAFASVSSAVERLARHDLTALAASGPARTRRKNDARQALRDCLAKIQDTAQVLADTPGNQTRSDFALAETFRLPGRARDETLVTTAREFAAAAGPLASAFVEHGMPATFVADLERLTAAFEAALRDRGITRDTLIAGRVSIEAAIDEGLAAMRTLDVIVANHLPREHPTREVWKRSRRIDYPNRPRRPVEQAPEAAPPEVPPQPAAAA